MSSRDAVLSVAPDIVGKVFKISKFGECLIFLEFLLVEIVRHNVRYGGIVSMQFCRGHVSSLLVCCEPSRRSTRKIGTNDVRRNSSSHPATSSMSGSTEDPTSIAYETR